MFVLNLDTNYWAWIGTIYLLWLTYMDYKNNMNIDERKNFMMLGVSLSVVAWFDHQIWYLLALTFFLVLFYWLANKYNVFGGADITSLSWIFLGYGLFSPYYLLWFVIFFAAATWAYLGVKMYIFKRTEPTPFMAVLLIVFVFNSYIFGLY